MTCSRQEQQGSFPPIAVSDQIYETLQMKCFYVLVHGAINWVNDQPDAERPDYTGFYCHRFVLASGPKIAVERAFSRVSDNLDQQFGWLSDGVATVDLEAEEVWSTSMLRAFKRDNRGHTFY